MGSRIHLNTSQEIQTQYLTRLIASQHYQTRRLIAGATEASRTRGTSPAPISALPRETSPARSQLAVSIFDAAEEESIPSLWAILRQDPSTIFAFDEIGQTALHIAAAKGNPELVAYLIRNGAKLNPDDNGGKTPLHCAILCENDVVVRALVSNGADVQAKDVDSRTPKDYTNPSSLLEWTLTFGAHLEARNSERYTALYHFASNGDLDAVRSLLDQGADVEAEGRWERTPLMEACDQGYVEVVKLLLARGANTEKLDDRKGTAIILAGLHGHTRVAEQLLDNGANINAQNQHAYTALAETCSHGREEMARLLLQRGAETETGRYAPLHEAAEGGYTNIVCDLLDHGAKIDANNDRFNWTALAEACWHGHLEVVQILLSAGAYTETHDYGLCCTPLIKAASKDYTPIVVHMLDQGKADIEGVDKEGRTALFHAVLGGHARTVQALLDRDANTEIHDSLHYTPLCRAAQSGRLAIVEKLLLANADIHASKYQSWTPLAEASYHGFPEIVMALLAYGANTESRDSMRYTPLNRAAQAGRLSLVILLLDTGKANIDAANHGGWTSLAEASFHGYHDVVKALLARGSSIEIKNDSDHTPLDLALIKKRKLVINEFRIHSHVDADRRGDERSKTKRPRFNYAVYWVAPALRLFEYMGIGWKICWFIAWIIAMNMGWVVIIRGLGRDTG